MAYASNRDRQPTQLEWSKTPWPVSPLNLTMTSGFRPGSIDLVWNDPRDLPLNTNFTILGVNLYRSFDSEFGPYQRVTDLLVGARYWQDRTDNEVVTEDVTSQFVLFGACAAVGDKGPRYVFKTQHFPIVKAGSQQVPADTGDARSLTFDNPSRTPRSYEQIPTTDVQVMIDGKLAQVLNVWGATGEVEIDPFTYTNVEKQSWDPSVVPSPQSVVTCTYRYTRQLVKTDLAQRIYYRVTTVGIPAGMDLSVAQPQDMVETPLEYATATNNFEIEKLDWIWREAVQRNRWILEQGGERVRVFLRKNVGIPCPCIGDAYHKQPRNDDALCYGTGIVHGYDGPYEIIIAPLDAEVKISQTDKGRTVSHTGETWTGPSPLLSQRDFIVKLNGDRYSIGPVRVPSNRGNILQQHFTIGHLDEKDIRYQVPMVRPQTADEFKPFGPEHEAEAEITNNPSIPVERQLRGRTPAWANITYGGVSSRKSRRR